MNREQQTLIDRVVRVFEALEQTSLIRLSGPFTISEDRKSFELFVPVFFDSDEAKLQKGRLVVTDSEGVVTYIRSPKDMRVQSGNPSIPRPPEVRNALTDYVHERIENGLDPGKVDRFVSNINSVLGTFTQLSMPKSQYSGLGITDLLISKDLAADARSASGIGGSFLEYFASHEPPEMFLAHAPPEAYGVEIDVPAIFSVRASEASPEVWYVGSLSLNGGWSLQIRAAVMEQGGWTATKQVLDAAEVFGVREIVGLENFKSPELMQMFGKKVIYGDIDPSGNLGYSLPFDFHYKWEPHPFAEGALPIENAGAKLIAPRQWLEVSRSEHVPHFFIGEKVSAIVLGGAPPTVDHIYTPDPVDAENRMTPYDQGVLQNLETAMKALAVGMN